jgi:hypothetical protein
MPMIVHIADERVAARIKRNGIALGESGRNGSGAVYFMPVMQDFFISHQWLRELKRRNAKTLVGVYARLPSHELVWAGRYNHVHRHIPLGEAIGELMRLPDPLGYEMFITRKISTKEITHIRALPQKVGWRYMPHAHGRPPCPCPACLAKGEVGVAKIRARLGDKPIPMPSLDVLRQQINESNDAEWIADQLWAFREKRRRASPEFLARLLDFDHEPLLQEVAWTLPHFKHPQSLELLYRLREHDSPGVQDAALESIDEYLKIVLRSAPTSINA